MNKVEITGTSVAADTDGLANDVTGASFALSATEAGDGLAHLIVVTNNSATDHTGKTIELVGTDADGNPQTETLTGPDSSTTSTSTKFFKTLESPVTPSATIGADTFDIGWTASSVTSWHHLNRDNNAPEFNFGFGCVIGASPTYGVQETYGDTANTAFDHGTVNNETTNQKGVINYPVKAIRLEFSAAGTVTLTGQMMSKAG